MLPAARNVEWTTFDDSVYTGTPDTLLYKFVDAVCGTTGAGALVNEIFMARANAALDTIYFNDLDYIFGSVNFLARTGAESYDYNPMIDLLTSDQWDEVRVKDAWYRERIKQFFAAVAKGGTPEGIRTCVNAALGVECDLFEVWRYCADEETEILTRSGYKSHHDLVEGEEVLTLNMTTGLSEWQGVSAVNRFPVEDEEMLSVEMQGHSSLTTMDHRWPVMSSRREHLGQSKYGPRQWERTIHRSRDLQREDKFIRAAAAVLPQQPKYADAFVEVVGWFITEGHCNTLGYAQNIAQSHKVNPHKVERIRTALTKTFGPGVDQFTTRTGKRADRLPQWRESVSPSKPDLTLFRLNSVAGALLAEVAPRKVASWEFIHSLTESQLTLFLDAVVAGDGSVRKGDGYRSIVQNSLERLVPIQVAASLLGIDTTYQTEQKHVGNGKPTTVLSLCEKSKYITPWGQSGRNVSTRRYTGTVWCPTTPNGTWFARRGGTHYFTGNSDNFGLGIYLGRSPVSARNELVVRPHKDSLNPGEARLLRDMLERIAPVDTIITVSLQGLAVSSPVTVASATADSTYFEVQKVVTSTPLMDQLPPPELLPIDLLTTEQWMYSKDPTLAPYAAFNITSEYGYYYLMGDGARSPIDNVTYGTLAADGVTVNPEQNFEVFGTDEQLTDWITYEKADSPDNFPGGKYGITPNKAPALNPDRTPYRFPFESQLAFVTQEILRITSLGGTANASAYRLPVTKSTVTKRIYWPEQAIATVSPPRDSTVSASITQRRYQPGSAEMRDPIVFVR